jgi:hypothetical protein
MEKNNIQYIGIKKYVINSQRGVKTNMNEKNNREDENNVPEDIRNMDTSELKQEIEYMLKELKNRDISITFKDKSEDNEKWVVCSNCYGEYELGELGYFLNPENNSVSGFCPNCGWIEFIKSDNFTPDPENEKILENGPEKVYPYPKEKDIIKRPDTNFQEKHQKIGFEYKQKQLEKNRSPLFH